MIFTIILICLGIWVIGGAAVYVIDFYTTRLLFYDWELKLNRWELGVAATSGIIVVFVLWLTCFSLKPSTFKNKQLWNIDPESTGTL